MIHVTNKLTSTFLSIFCFSVKCRILLCSFSRLLRQNRGGHMVWYVRHVLRMHVRCYTYVICYIYVMCFIYVICFMFFRNRWEACSGPATSVCGRWRGSYKERLRRKRLLSRPTHATQRCVRATLLERKPRYQRRNLHIHQRRDFAGPKRYVFHTLIYCGSRRAAKHLELGRLIYRRLFLFAYRWGFDSRFSGLDLHFAF